MAWFDPLNNSGGVPFDFFDFTYLSIPPTAIGQVLPSKASHSTLAQTDGAVPGGYRNTNKCEYLVEIENDVNGVWPQSNIDPDLVTTSTLPMYSPPL